MNRQLYSHFFLEHFYSTFSLEYSNPSGWTVYSDKYTASYNVSTKSVNVSEFIRLRFQAHVQAIFGFHLWMEILILLL